MIFELEQQSDIKIGDVRCLTFRLGNEMCAIRIDNVKEVLEIEGITHVPRTANHLCGVFNLRGAVVPVIDVRFLFNPQHVVADDPRGTSIFFDIHDPAGVIMVGMLADEVYEVIELSSEELEPNTHEGNGKFIKYIIKRGEEFILVLDIHLLLASIDEGLLTRTEAE
ncbi:MAG: chemotaxis protein CheW [Spirochaetia bacterium]